MKTPRIKALLTLLLLIVGPTIVLAATTVEGVVMAPAAYVYSDFEGQPGKAFPMGSPIEVIAVDGYKYPKWVRVRVNGEDGWMRMPDLTTPKKYRRFVGEPLAQAIPLQTDTPGLSSINPISGSNVTTSNLPHIPGSQVRQTYDPAHPEAQILNVPAPNCEAPATPRPGVLFTKPNSLNLRKSGSTDSEALGKFPQNTAVQTLCANGPWTQVSVDGQTGWMRNDYLAPSSTVAPAAVASYAPAGGSLTTATTMLTGFSAQTPMLPPAALPYAPAGQPESVQSLTPVAVTSTPQFIPPASVGVNHCIDSLNPQNQADQELINELQRELQVTTLHNALSTDSQSGTAFKLSQVGESMIVTITNLPETARDNIANGLSPAIKLVTDERAEVDKAIASGQIAFEVGQLCRREGHFSVSLEGVNAAKGSLGELALQPAQGRMLISGNIGPKGKAPTIQINNSSFTTRVTQ